MRNKINLSFLSIMLLLLVITACSASPKADATETPESIAIATESWTKTPTPTTIPSATPTVTSSPTIIPSPTFTSTPAPTPTAPPVSPEFTNLTLALDYNKDTLDPISPQDYFPLGVSYIAVVFDYLVPSWTTIHWYISDPDGTIKESGSVNLNPRKNINTFIIQPEMGLDEGIHEILFEFDNEPVLNKQFDVYWNPTVWPVSIGTDVYSDYSVENDGNTFPHGTEFLAAVYPTINFIVGDEIFTEWFVNGEKLGEHQYVWDNSEWSSGMHVNKVDNQMSADQPLPIGNYELFVHVNGAKKQCKPFQIIEEDTVSSESIDTPDSVLGCESFISEPSRANSPNTWNRYEARTFSELESLVDKELVFDATDEDYVYLEMSQDYQHPSRINVVFTGNFRETPASTLEWIKGWMATASPNLTGEEVSILFGQEGLFTEGSVEYWLPIQNTLIPIMEDELSAGNNVDLLVTWTGAVKKSGQIEKIYLVNAFE